MEELPPRKVARVDTAPETTSIVPTVDHDSIKTVRRFFPGCRNVDEYEKINKISEDRAKDLVTGEIVALKKIKMEREKDGFPVTALREINVLLRLRHPNIITVKEVVMGNTLDEIFMVMEFMQHDMRGLMDAMSIPFVQSEIKCLLQQLLSAMDYMHDNYVLHRDIKTSNILFNNSGVLKVCDFGLARAFGSPLRPYTGLVVTLWYRAPELLLGQKVYSEAVDMWSIGCIFGEICVGEPFFQGKGEVDQMAKICETLGRPNATIWPDLPDLPNYNVPSFNNILTHKRYAVPNLRARMQKTMRITSSGVDLLEKLLEWDPKKRISAKDALKHPYFREEPRAKDVSDMPTFPSVAEGASRPRRKHSLEDELIRQQEELLAKANEDRYQNHGRERNYG